MMGQQISVDYRCEVRRRSDRGLGIQNLLPGDLLNIRNIALRNSEFRQPEAATAIG